MDSLTLSFYDASILSMGALFLGIVMLVALAVYVYVQFKTPKEEDFSPQDPEEAAVFTNAYIAYFTLLFYSLEEEYRV